MNETADNTKIEILEYWQIFLRRKYFFIIPFVLGLIGGLIVGLITKPVYQSSTVVQISQSQLLSKPMQQMIPGVTVEERHAKIKRLITSYDYLKRLIETLNLYTDPNIKAEAEKDKNKYPDLEMNQIIELLWINQLKKFLSVRQIESDFIQISAVAYSPELAYNFAKTLTQIFIDEALRREIGGIRNALDFSSEQLSIYKKRLEESEQRLQQFKEGLLKDQFDNHLIISSNLDKVTSMLNEIDFELKEATDRINFLFNQTKKLGISYRLGTNSELNYLKTRLLEATLELSKLMLKYSWEDAQVLKLSGEIEDLRTKIRRKIESEVKKNYSDGKKLTVNIIVLKEFTAIDIEFLERKWEAFSRLVQYYKENVSKEPSREMTLSRLEREVATNREIYQMFLQQTHGSEIEQELQRTSAESKFKIIEPAIKPIKPIKPNRIKIILMAALMGSAIGGGLIFLLEYTDHSFKKVEDVETYLDLPVLATISPLEKENYDEDSLSSIEFRHLCSKLGNLNSGKKIKNLLITSATLGEGKSTTAALLAVTLSKYLDNHTLLIDCDLRRPKIHKLFGLKREHGFSDVVQKAKPVRSMLKETFVSKLKVMTSGKLTNNSAKLFNLLTIKELFAECRLHFDTIVVDSAPTLLVSDTLRLSSEIDGVLLVVKAGKTHREVAKRAADLMRSAGFNILGVILNNVENVLPYYYNYHRDYYHYTSDIEHSIN